MTHDLYTYTRSEARYRQIPQLLELSNSVQIRLLSQTAPVAFM